MSNIYAWDVIAGNNANADSSINWAEGMPPSDVNDSARVMMARVKELLIDIGGSIAATGTANNISVSAQSGFTTLANGRMVSFRAIANNTQATTLNVNSIGAKPVLKATGSGIVALSGREIQSGGMYTAQYSTALNSGNGAWLLLNPTTQTVPAGFIGFTGASAAPDGWLLCFGQTVSRTTYADLFSAIGTTYGAGDGSTTFRLPDGRGRVIAGKDNMGGTSADRLTNQSGGLNGDVLGDTGGTETHTLTTAQMPAHTHTVSGTTNTTGAHTHTFTGKNSVGVTQQATSNNFTGPDQTITTSSAGAHSHTVSGTAASQGGGGAHNNVQPTIIFNTIIKT